MTVAVSVALGVVQGLLLLCLAHHYGLLAASMRSSPPLRCVSGSAPSTRFAIAIPAHNEAPVLSATLARLQQQAYPSELFDVHVVADHCTDATADVARQGGAFVHERDTLPKGRKAYALQWLLERILDRDPPYDAVAIFDADSLVDPGFLAAMHCHLLAGERVLQGQHIISNPGDALFAALAAVDMRLNNRLRNQSRHNLGFSCRLMGDAMVLDARILRAVGWLGQSVSEDREYGYELTLRGIRVCYVPEAQSYGQAVSTWVEAGPQRLRWHGGAAGMRRRLAGRLVAGAFRTVSPALLDASLELILPSYSVLTAVSALNLAVVAALGLLTPLFLPGPSVAELPWAASQAGQASIRGILGWAGSAALLAAWGLYPVLGLLVDRAPRWAFRALLIGPAYLLWRLWIALLVRVRGADGVAWVRTPRRRETDGGSR